MTKEELDEILDEELQKVSSELTKAFRSIMPTLRALNAVVFADD